MSIEEQKYWLSPHAHVCVMGDDAVVLDLRRDKYIGIKREHVPVLATSVVGWPAATTQRRTEPTASAKVLLQQMVSKGLLTTDPTHGRRAQPPAVPSVQFAAIEADLEYRPAITLRNVSQMLLAAAKAKALLKWRPIETVVARVQHRKQQRGRGEFDFDAARPLIEAFLHLRPLMFTTKDECLYDSLVLVELLALNQLFPLWLIGVSSGPFRAHSWVQVGDRVLNDLPERVCGFTPILAV